MTLGGAGVAAVGGLLYARGRGKLKGLSGIRTVATWILSPKKASPLPHQARAYVYAIKKNIFLSLNSVPTRTAPLKKIWRSIDIAKFLEVLRISAAAEARRGSDVALV